MEIGYYKIEFLSSWNYVNVPKFVNPFSPRILVFPLGILGNKEQHALELQMLKTPTEFIRSSKLAKPNLTVPFFSFLLIISYYFLGLPISSWRVYSHLPVGLKYG